jgi:hypothetical protein|tara:strand:- start:2385 stop:2537 length:153 start_codon:yes stop_codon:yes gene_type:complete
MSRLNAKDRAEKQREARKRRAKEKGKTSSLKKAMQGITPKQQRKRNEGRY